MDMQVCWSLKGMCLHNLTVALCCAPILHQRLTMAQRCECAVAGFVLFDLWALLAHQPLGLEASVTKCYENSFVLSP